MAVSASTKTAGFWAAGCCTFFSLTYIVAQFFEWAGMLGSAGGPDASSTSFGIAILLTPSLLLGPSFVVLMAALHSVAPPDRKVFSLSGLAFAIMYATLTGLVYFVQLTFVGPQLAKGDTADIAILLFVPYKSFLFAIDLLGYSLMSCSTLFTAFALPAVRIRTWARSAMIANGLIMPFLAFQMFVPALIWPASAWAVTFPLSSALLALLFREIAPTR